MGVALYRKYRSKSLDEIVGQEHITTALKNAVKQGKLSHAYLFAGPRGVGKTSIARILAHLVNDLDYKEGTEHLDIIEIDAASNRKIDEIRELRERVHVAPAQAKYKVYIIDEVHMLTREAFNALLKTLEEPPEHVIFILATTEAHKLPETIISRTQRYHFKPIGKAEAVKHLISIAKTEKIDIDDEALEIIAHHGDGSFRDSISLLDQMRGLSQPITADLVLHTLGIPPEQLTEELYAHLVNGDVIQLLNTLDKLNQQGYLAPQIAKQLARIIRKYVISGQARARDMELLKQLLEIPTSHDPISLLEITLLANMEVTTPAVTNDLVQSEPEDPPVLETPKPSKLEESDPPKKETKKTPNKKLNDEVWQEVLATLKQRHNTLYSVARIAQVQFDSDKVVLGFSFPFHQKRMSEPRNSAVLSEVVKSVTGTPITVVCELVETDKTNANDVKNYEKTAKPDLENISNIFGGAEVLE